MSRYFIYSITDDSGNIATLNGRLQVYSFDLCLSRGEVIGKYLEVFGSVNMPDRQSEYDGIPSQDGGSGGDPFGTNDPYWTYLTSIYGPTQSPFYYQGALFQFNQFTGQYETSDFGGASASPGGGHYVGNGQYEDNAGNHISWNYVYENFVLPNASETYNLSSINPVALKNFSFNALLSGQIGYEYLDPGSSYINSAGQHVGFGVIDAMASGDNLGSAGGGESKTLFTINTIAGVTSFTAAAVRNILTSTKVGGNVAYALSNSKIFLTSVKYLKPFGYWATGVSIVSDAYLSATGQQSWGESITNMVVTGIAFGVGGWPGLVIQFDYIGAKAYLRTVREHPEWILPASYHSFMH